MEFIGELYLLNKTSIYMKKFLLILIYLGYLSSQYSNATPQAPDLLIYREDTLHIYSFPFEQYLYENPQSEHITTEIKKVMLLSTAMWRGLQATYEIKNDSLFLKKVEGKTELDLALLFGKSSNIFMNWVSHTLTSYKNRLWYDHGMFNGGFFEFEKDFHIENGILKKTEDFQNIIQPSIYLADYETLSNYVKEAINYKHLPKLEKEVRIVLKISQTQVTPKGKITDVIILRGYTKQFDNEAIRVIKSIPQWLVVIRRGKPAEYSYTIPIFFRKEDQDKQLRE